MTGETAEWRFVTIRCKGPDYDLPLSPFADQLCYQAAAEPVGGGELQVALARLRTGGVARSGLLLNDAAAEI